tara:strand:- start:187 stop:498 length:312 start_codon:yes stop_codon:yes gene_type:complete
VTYKFLPEALIRLAPNKAFVINGDFELKNVAWNENVSDSEIPLDQDIKNKCAELQADYDSKQYQRDRAITYPSWQDQLDNIFHNGIDAWRADIQAIKDQYPKP